MLDLLQLAEVKGTLTPVKRARPNGVLHFRGVDFWGVTVFVKIAAPGVLRSESNMVQILSSLPKLCDIMCCYLYAGQAPVRMLTRMLSKEWQAVRKQIERFGHLADVIITEDFGKDLFAQCRAAAIDVVDDTQLEDRTLRLLLRVFTMMKRLRDDGGCRHQDLKPDNIGEMGGQLCLIDFEFANSQSMPNEDADIEGCGMQSCYNDGSDHFDIHTLLYSVLYYCGKRYKTLPRLETLRASLLGREWPTASPDNPGRNIAGESIVYMVKQPTRPCTCDAAIAITRELIQLVV